MTEKELMHFGVKGMKWGKRKTTTSPTLKGKKRLTITDSGMLSISDKPISKKGVINFTARIVMTVGWISASIYISSHPQQVRKGKDAVDNILFKASRKIKPVDSGIFSKNLGRMLSIAEALDAGFDLRD